MSYFTHISPYALVLTQKINVFLWVVFPLNLDFFTWKTISKLHWLGQCCNWNDGLETNLFISVT